MRRELIKLPSRPHNLGHGAGVCIIGGAAGAGHFTGWAASDHVAANRAPRYQYLLLADMLRSKFDDHPNHVVIGSRALRAALQHTNLAPSGNGEKPMPEA